MSFRGKPRRGVRALAVTTVSGVVGSLVGAAGLMAAGVGNAEPASLTLNYECPFPLIGVQQVETEISADIPREVEVGEATPEFDVDTITTAPPEATEGLSLVGATTIEGEAVAESFVEAPEATLDVQVPAEIPVQDVPEEGELIVEAFGSAPSLTFSEAGNARIGVGDLQLTMTPRDADGNETGLGTFDSECTQLPDQDNILAEIEITDPGEPDPPEVPVVSDHGFEVAQGDVLSVGAPGLLEGATPGDVDLTAAVESGPSGGSVDVAGDGSFTYEPDEGFSGEDTFSYTASYEVDGESVVSEPGTVTVTVTEVDEPDPPEVPVVSDHGFEVAQGDVLSVGAPGLLEGATPGDVDLTAAVESGPSGGSVDVAGDGSFTYEPDEGFSGEDTFSYTASYEVDGESVVSEPGTVTVTVTEADEPDPGLDVSYDLAGESYINAADTTVALNGGVEANVDLQSGDVEADLQLDRTSASFRVFWILPASAEIDFEQVGTTTGTFADGQLDTSSEMLVKLPRVSVLGFPISQGDGCRTAEPTQLDLTSEPGFSPTEGGALSGEYTLPDLEGCGLLTPIVSAYTAGPGNTVDVELTSRSES
ncbi:Ig-like domain-containing protein [Haloechinothrix sp. YIM 98757]|uniref:Ig-like domain-containing protein n=1 Tax=Haloechinothrix aidingensis TaxID=2752311 RepID=A0A838A985_9PSEU|nr:Ig-like domain-containing protein [Haloechinothrix aidingensis]MBA0125507.1 Ig-like domain-containing protein [Haloechinothrix aidingensis]